MRATAIFSHGETECFGMAYEKAANQPRPIAQDPASSLAPSDEEERGLQGRFNIFRVVRFNRRDWRHGAHPLNLEESTHDRVGIRDEKRAAGIYKK
jgi:hypothetical protein